MDKIKKFTENTIGYKVSTSLPVMLLQVLVAALAFHFNKPIVSVFFFVAYIAVLLIVSKDMTPIFLPLMLMIMTLLASYGGTPADFIQAAPLVIICFVLILLRPLLFRVKWKIGKMLIPMVLVSVSLTLGGVGALTAAQYFRLVPMYYVIGLGFGLVLTYMMMLNYTLKDSVHNPMKVLTKSMIMIGLLGVLMVYPVVLDAVMKGKDWSIQWSNNLSTFFILSMPFAFYMAATTEKYGVAYYLFGCLQFMGCVLTLSRGGILFGAITFVMCVVASLVCVSKTNRIIYASIVAAGMLLALIVLVTDKELVLYIEKLMEVSPDEARVNMFKMAIDNFLKYPLLGTGLAFEGEFYRPQAWAIWWLHSTPFQIISSLGIVGIMAYALQFFYRARVCLARPSKFNVFVTVSIIGFELMACVNPGDFTPLPFMVAFTAIMTVLEISNRDRVLPRDMMYNKYKGANWYELQMNYTNYHAKTPPEYFG